MPPAAFSASMSYIFVSSSTWPRWSRPIMPRCETLMPVALATIACSNEIFEPSAKLVTMCGFCPHCFANASCVVGLRYGSCRPLMLPQTSGVRPIDFTNRHRFICTPGWSPSQPVRITPARSALCLRIAPTVPSSSAFISTMWLPWAIASSTTSAENPIAPVASISTSIVSARASSMASPVIAGVPARIASSSASWVVTSTRSPAPAPTPAPAPAPASS